MKVTLDCFELKTMVHAVLLDSGTSCEDWCIATSRGSDMGSENQGLLKPRRWLGDSPETAAEALEYFIERGMSGHSQKIERGAYLVIFRKS